MTPTPSFAKYPDLAGKTALIMGIGQTKAPGSETWGNGAAIARVLAHNGAKVFGCDLNLSAAEYTASRIRDEGGICDVIQADVTSVTDVQKVADALVARHGRIDILVNNVGMTATGDPASMSEEVWDRQIQVNLKSVYTACHVVLPIMERQGAGVVVNNASIAGLRYIGKPQVAYSSAKAAVIHFTRVTAVMYAGKGVRLNSIAPGLMYTPLVESLKTSGQEEAYRRIMEQPIPMGRMGDAFDVASATAFLASDAAGYITGQNLVVDGGFTSSAVSKL
ncbi:SDR family NAD(P)-dependent oxidoreductase [Aspergillus lucknowensis]|uniref:Short chain type dehydrogenase n=1 Tax=Aspergillus lucknowensis TaxID=176173 RepID=A0ABR4LTE6_9EURO